MQTHVSEPRPPLRAQEVVDHFEAVAPVYYEVVDSYETGLSYYHRRELEASMHWIASRGAQRVLDAGCGPGRLTLRLLSDGRDVVSLDFSRNMLLLVRREGQRTPAAGSPKLVRGSVDALPFRSNSFDFIVLAEVLEHLPSFPADAGAVFSEVARVLQSHGYFVLEFPLVAHTLLRRLPRATVPWATFAKPEWDAVPRPPLRFQRRFRLCTVERMLRKVGFAILERRYFRVVPSGFVRMLPGLEKVDSVLEKVLLIRSFAREVVLLVQKRKGVDGTREAG